MCWGVRYARYTGRLEVVTISRGPGKIQREILEAVQVYGWSFVTSAGLTDAEKSARRRAARSLEKQGKVRLAMGWWSDPRRRQLIAYAPDDPKAPASAYVEGKDGKIYPVTASSAHSRAEAATDPRPADA